MVPDAQLLFHGDFKRSGGDLILSGDEREFVIHDYFKDAHRKALASPDGAHLTPDLVKVLTGEVDVSQADSSAQAGTVIGHVTKLVGSATCVRNGVSVILNMGDNVEKGDVVQSGSDSTLGVTFIDGTVFGLSSNARMVLNEMVYDPNGSSNSSLMSLVAGTITFVAGETAKHGDMKIDTPVATMGIRGTAVLVEIDFTVPGQGGTPNTSFQVLVEPDGTTGSYVLFDKTTLQPIAMVDKAGVRVEINQYGVSQSNTQLSPDLLKLINDVFEQKFSDNSNTKSTTNFTDSTNPSLLTQTFALTNGTIATAVFQVANNTLNPANTQTLSGPNGQVSHIPGAPTVTSLDLSGNLSTSFQVTDLAGTGKIGGFINFVDPNSVDRPTVAIAFQSASGAGLTPTQLAHIEALEIDVVVVPGAGNNNNGTAQWTYSLPGNAADFLTAGETVTLTYTVTVSNNFAQNPQSTSFPITITIIGTSPTEIWTHTPTDGNDNQWTTDQNWKSGHAPVATDDVFIITDQGNTNTPSYPAIIAEGTKAVANSVTMDDLGSIAPELDIAGGASLTIGTLLNLSADSILDNSGTLTVNGPMELLDKTGALVSLNASVVTNSGQITLGQGGDIQGLASIINSGFIELQGGILNVLVNVTNSQDDSPGHITVDPGATLVLGTDPNNSDVHGGITGGTVTINGQLDLTGGNFLSEGTLANNGAVLVTGIGNAWHDENVTANVLLDVQGGLTVDQGSKVANTQTTVDDGATLTINTATFTGGTVTINGELDQTGNAVLASGTLANNGSVVVTGTGNAWDDESVTANVLLDVQGALTVDQGSKVANTQTTIDDGATLTVDTATFTGGVVTINGTLISTGTSFITAATINNSSNLEVAGGTLTIDPATVTNTGTILVTNNSTLVLNGETVINSVTDPVTKVITNGTIQVDAVDATHFSTLALQSSAIDGGFLTISGLLQSTGTSFVTGVDFTNTGATDVVSGTLTLNSTTVSGGGSVTVESGSVLDLIDAILIGGTLGGPGTIGTAAGNTDSTLKNITNDATVTAAVGELDLTGTITNNGEFDANSGTGISLDLENVTLTGGTLGGSGKIGTAAGNVDSTLKNITNDATVTAAVGELDLTGTITNNGEFDANSGTGISLDLENVTLTGGTLGGSGKIGTAAGNTDSTLKNITNDATVTAAVGELDLTGTITNNGEFDANSGTGISLDLENVTLTGGTLGGSGKIGTASGNTTGSTLNGVTLKSGTTVTAAAGVLNLTGTITNNGEIDANSGTGIAIDLVSLTLLGGTLGGLGSIATASPLNTFNGVTIANGTTVKVADNTALDLKGTIQLDAVDTTHFSTLALNSTGDVTQLEISGSVFLDGGGHVTLGDNTHNAIVSDGSAAILNNSDTIAGAGSIGDANLTLSNSGIIDATGSNPLIIDTGTNPATGPKVGSILVTNNVGGVLEADPGHTLQIDDNVLNSGTILAGNSSSSSASSIDITGSITGTGSIDLYNNATVEIGGAVSSTQTVTFENAGGASTLILDDSHQFSGTIVGLVEASNEGMENHVDLTDLKYVSGHMHITYDDSTDVLTVTAGSDSVSLNVSDSGNFDPAFEFTKDSGTGTLIDDPSASGPMTISSGQTLDISGAGTGPVSFTDSSGNTGELVLQHSTEFTGTITGFTGDGTLANSDLIDLQDINFAKLTTETYTENASGTGGALTLSDGTDTTVINFLGNYTLANFNFSTDGSGGTLVVDPPTQSATSSGQFVFDLASSTQINEPSLAQHATISGTTNEVIVAGNGQDMLTGNGAVDRFVFAPTTSPSPVQHTVTNFNTNLDTIDLQQFGKTVTSAADLIANHTTQVGADTLIAVDSNDSILLKNVHAANLHTTDFLVHA